MNPINDLKKQFSKDGLAKAVILLMIECLFGFLLLLFLIGLTLNPVATVISYVIIIVTFVWSWHVYTLQVRQEDELDERFKQAMLNEARSKITEHLDNIFRFEPAASGKEGTDE
jgi:uncharacterized protein YacL